MRIESFSRVGFLKDWKWQRNGMLFRLDHIWSNTIYINRMHAVSLSSSIPFFICTINLIYWYINPNWEWFGLSDDFWCSDHHLFVKLCNSTSDTLRLILPLNGYILNKRKVTNERQK